VQVRAAQAGDVPVGLMLAATAGSDRRIFELAPQWKE